LPVTFGGGVRTIEDAKKVFDTGVDRIALNSVLYSQSSLIDDVSEKFGTQSILASISTRFHKGNWMTFANSGRDKTLKSLATWMEDLKGRPVGEYLITSITRDGMLTGPDLALIEHVREIGVERVLYCGGIQNLDQARELARTKGLRGVAMSRVILESAMFNE
jgi:cyclase